MTSAGRAASWAARPGATRNKGLLGRKGMETGRGLWIVPCESVHTFSCSSPSTWFISIATTR